jgi:hypothetical protein
VTKTAVLALLAVIACGCNPAKHCTPPTKAVDCGPGAACLEGFCVQQPELSVASATIEGVATGNEVRQGSGPVVIVVKGQQLEAVEQASVGGVPATIDARSAEAMRLSWNVVHGASLGPRNLLIEGDAGAAMLPNVVEVTAITSGPSGEDDGGRGTPSAPFRTMTHALGVAEAGDTVQLLAGSYSVDAGERWLISLNAPFNVRNGVTLRGAGPEQTTLVGPNVAQSIGVHLQSGGVVTDLGIRGFEYGVVARGDGGVKIANVALHTNLTNLSGQDQVTVVVSGESRLFDAGFFNVTLLGRARMEMTGGQIVRAKQTGVSLTGDAGALLTRVELTGNGTAGGHSAVRASQQSFAELRSCDVHDNFHAGVDGLNNSRLYLEGTRLLRNPIGAVVAGDTVLVIDGGEITGCTDGIGNNGGDGGLRISLEGVTVSGSLSTGVSVASSTLIVRRTVFRANNAASIRIATRGANVDLGTATDPGQNTFTAAGTGPHLLDTSNPGTTFITASKSAIEGHDGGRVTVDGGNVDEYPRWRINVGNKLEYFP